MTIGRPCGAETEGVVVTSGATEASNLASPSTAGGGSIPFTLGRWTAEGEIDRVIDVRPRVVDRLRARSGR